MRYIIVTEQQTPSEPEVELYLREYSGQAGNVVQLLARRKGEGHGQTAALVTFDMYGKASVAQDNVFAKVGLKREILGTT